MKAALEALRDGADGLLLYDGECPFCRRYSRWVRLRETLSLRLVDAREQPALVGELAAAGYDLDAGMLLIWQGQYHHGEAALQRLALLSTPVGWFNRLNRFLFSRPRLARLAYPLLRAGRNLALRLLGRSRLLD